MVQVRRVRAANPSAMTGTGTNSYIVGTGHVAIIDPGPDDPAHLSALLTALHPDEAVSAILVTHAHLDHSALAPRLSAQTQAPIHAFGPAQSGRSNTMKSLVKMGLTGGGEGVDTGFSPDHFLADGQEINLGGLKITALHTPGHMGGHLCFACRDILFSGDHVMGWASSLISPPDGDMGAYMASLDRLLTQVWQQMLPGHGESIDDPTARLRELIAHRRQRESEVLTALATAPGTAAQLAGRIYTTTPAQLIPAAARNVLAHLIDLTERNLAQPEGAIGANTVFHCK